MNSMINIKQSNEIEKDIDYAANLFLSHRAIDLGSPELDLMKTERDDT